MCRSRKRVWRFLALAGFVQGALTGIVRGQWSPEPFVIDGIPRHIIAGPGGNLWYTTDFGIGQIMPDGDSFPQTSGSIEINGLASGPDGKVWFTESRGVGRIDPSGIRTFPIPSGGQPDGIVAGPDGSLWFTETDAGMIGRVTTSGVITEFSLPSTGSRPFAIIAGPDGNLWFTEGTGVGRITTAGVATEFSVPGGASDIAAGPDGALWLVCFSGSIGRMTTAGAFTAYEVPTYADLGGITSGPDGALWFTTDTSLGRITTSGEVDLFPVPFPIGTPSDIVTGPDGNLWFTAPAANAIGRAMPREASSNCVADATTLCLNGRFRVHADWQRTSSSQSVPASARSLAGNTGSFWFFEPDSIELIVKVLDGCAVNGHHWVFAAGLTNVQTSLDIADTTTGETWRYTSSGDAAFPPVQDTSAFSTCP